MRFSPLPDRPPLEAVKQFVDAHRQRLGVEPICRVLQIAPSACWREAAWQRNQALQPARRQRDASLMPLIDRVRRGNLTVYGADKVWRQLARESIVAACCTVERLMRQMGLRGAMRGKRIRTTIPDSKAPRPLDHVDRDFHAWRPNELWVTDFTYVSTWQGFVYAAIAVDAFARYLVGLPVSTSMQTDFVLDALEQARYARRPAADGQLTHNSDRGPQYMSIRYSERLEEAGILPSLGSKGDSCDNAQAERDDQRPVKGGDHSQTRTLENARGCGV